MLILAWCLNHPKTKLSFEFDGEDLFFGLDASEVGVGASNSMKPSEAAYMDELRLVNEIEYLWKQVMSMSNQYAEKTNSERRGSDESSDTGRE